MDMGLMGKLALVTGSTRGLGKAIAIALAKEGVRVIINGRDEKRVMEVVREIYFDYRVTTYPCVADVTDSKAIKDFFASSIFTMNPMLDILVNNVGNTEKFGNFTDLKDEDWLSCYDLTFMGAVRFIREALPFLIASGNGKIINISSLIAHQPGSFFPHYASAKAALNILTKYLANNLGNKNISANTICPSNIDWDKNVEDRARRDGISVKDAEIEICDKEKNKSPLGRVGTLDDVANLVVYIASKNSGFLTGHIYNVDGGITRGL